MQRSSASSSSLHDELASTSSTSFGAPHPMPGASSGPVGGVGAAPFSMSVASGPLSATASSGTDNRSEKILNTRSFSAGGQSSLRRSPSTGVITSWSSWQLGFGVRTIGTVLLVMLSLYAGSDLLIQMGLEQGLANDSLPGDDRRVKGGSWLDDQGSGRRRGERNRRWSKGNRPEVLNLAQQVVDATAFLHSVIKQRLDENFAMISPALRLLAAQEKEGRQEVGRFSQNAVAGWVLRVGHWVRPAPGLVAEALEQGNVLSLEKQRELQYNPSRRLFLPCARQYRALDEILLQPHGCSPGERRYFHSGVWMDWQMLFQELSRPGGGGGHNYNDAVCVVACVDRPQPLCSSLDPAKNNGGAVGFPCVHLLALRQQRNVSTDAKELAEVYEAEMPLPWLELQVQDQGQEVESTEREVEEGSDGNLVSPVPETWTGAILDAGSGIGISSIFLSSLYPGRLIISLEASTKAFKLLKHNCQAYPSIVPWNAVLWPPTAAQHPPPPPPQQGIRKTPPSAKSGPLVDGAFLQRVFGTSKFDIILLNLRQGGEEFLFPSQQKHQRQQNGSPILTALTNMEAASEGEWPPLPPSLGWLDSADMVVLYQQISQSYSGEEVMSSRGHNAIFNYFTQSRLGYEPVALRPEMLRKGSHDDEDLPMIFAKRQGQELSRAL